MRLILRPIDRWPHPNLTADRKRSPFGATHGDTLALLDRELRHLDASNPVLMRALREDDIRLDGELRANARAPEHPGVVLAFESETHGSLKYATDRFTTWQANLRAIALGLEALRKVDRFGITSRGEQYTGWKALGSGIALSAGFETARQAADFLVSQAVDDFGAELYRVDDVLPAEGVPGAFLEDAFRVAAKRLHPDAGGDADLFKRVNAARVRLNG